MLLAVEGKWLCLAGGQGSGLILDQMESLVCAASLYPSSYVERPAETGVAGSSCPSAAPGLRTVNEEREGPYGFVWICTQARQNACMLETVCVCVGVQLCVCMRVFDLYAGQAPLKQQQFN